MAVKRMSLKEWIESEGGPTRVGKLLGVREATVRHWSRGHVLPKDEMKLKIRKLREAHVESADDMISRHFSATNKERWTTR